MSKLLLWKKHLCANSVCKVIHVVYVFVDRSFYERWVDISILLNLGETEWKLSQLYADVFSSIIGKVGWNGKLLGGCCKSNILAFERNEMGYNKTVLF